MISKIAEFLFKDPRSNDAESPSCTVLNEIYSTFHLIVSKRISLTPRSLDLLFQDNYFTEINFGQFFYELHLTIFQCGIKAWNSSEIESKPPIIVNVIMLLLSRLFSTNLTTDFTNKPSSSYIDWRDIRPSETLRKAITGNFDITDEDRLYNVLQSDRQSLDDLSNFISFELKLDLNKVKEVIAAAKPYGPPRPNVAIGENGEQLRTYQQLSQFKSYVARTALDKIVNLIRLNSEIVLAACHLLLALFPLLNRKYLSTTGWNQIIPLSRKY